MSKILGIYIIKASLKDFTTGFTFQNAGQDEQLTIASDKVLNCNCTDISRPVNNTVSFLVNNVMKIRRARIVTTGAAGLRGGLDDVAARLSFVAFGLNDTTTPIGGFQLGFEYFNDWENFNIDFMPSIMLAPNKNFYLGVDHAYSKMSVEDYNVQADYIGKTFVPFIEMEIDTAGILDYNGGVV